MTEFSWGAKTEVPTKGQCKRRNKRWRFWEKLSDVSVKRSENPLLLTNTYYFKNRLTIFVNKQQLV